MKTLLFRIISLIIVFNAPLLLSAQLSKSDKSKPQWLHSTLTPSNSTFIYEVVPSNAKSLKEARDLAISALILEAGLEAGQTVQSKVENYEEGEQVFVNGKNNVKSTAIIKIESTLKGEPATLTAKKIDEYWERGADGTYHLMSLYARSQVDGTPNFDDVTLTTKYGTTALWRSAIAPGWGQLYKGSSLKGGLIIGGSVAFIGGIIYTENMRQDYMNKIKKTHNTDNIRTYKTRADNFAMGRNICIGGLAALYVYNIVDAIVAPGARRVVVKKNVNGRTYSLAPSVTFDGSPAMCAQIVF